MLVMVHSKKKKKIEICSIASLADKGKFSLYYPENFKIVKLKPHKKLNSMLRRS